MLISEKFGLCIDGEHFINRDKLLKTADAACDEEQITQK